MTLDISFQPLHVLSDGHDGEGDLILVDGELAAVIVHLDGESYTPKYKGLWSLEAGFGKCALRYGCLFQTLEEAGAWVQRRMMVKAA